MLVVDDSPLVRQTLSTLLQSEPGIEVTLAPDPIFAAQKIQKERPHVIVLDLTMPRMDGLTFLEMQMRTDPIPVVICAALGDDSERKAMRALELGAMRVIGKPSFGVRDFLRDAAAEIVDAVREAAESRSIPPPPPAPPPAAHSARRAHRLIAIGASAGGTEALRRILPSFPQDGPPVLIAQHMPAGFTRAFAKQLDAICSMEVREAADGDAVTRGLVLVAPGHRQMQLRGGAAGLRVEISNGSPTLRHRPSVDVLFHSVAEVVGARAVGVVLTGMGDDGVLGLAAMRARGAITVAQDEASCAVYGMPREAVRRGAVDRVVALESMGEALLACCAEPTARDA